MINPVKSFLTHGPHVNCKLSLYGNDIVMNMRFIFGDD